MKQMLELNVNGQIYEVMVDPHETLANVLRERLCFHGVRLSCDTGNCGSCTILINGKAVKSCIMLALQAKGKEIITIEGLRNKDRLHPLQQAFIDNFAVQCGYCTSGMILAAKALLTEIPDATEAQVRSALSGNLCRCTGYHKIVEAIMAARNIMKEKMDLDEE